MSSSPDKCLQAECSSEWCDLQALFIPRIAPLISSTTHLEFEDHKPFDRTRTVYILPTFFVRVLSRRRSHSVPCDVPPCWQISSQGFGMYTNYPVVLVNESESPSCPMPLAGSVDQHRCSASGHQLVSSVAHVTVRFHRKKGQPGKNVMNALSSIVN